MLLGVAVVLEACVYVAAQAPLAPLRGRVVAPDGSPVEGAHVALYEFRSWTDGGGFYLEGESHRDASTDDNGDFVFDSLEGLRFPDVAKVFLLAESQGFGPAGIPMSSAGAWGDPVTLQLAEPARITLHVTPCPAQWQTIVISDVSELARRVNLDTDCSAHLGLLAAGEAAVFPWSEELGWIGTGYRIDLEPDQDNRIDLTLRANSISGLVVAEGHPSPAVAVKLEYVEPDEIPAELERTTDARGEFAFYDIDPGKWRVSVAGSHCGARVVDIAIGQDIRIELERN